MRQMVFRTAMLLVLAISLNGQTQGTITGVVSDPSGAVVPNAAVRVTNTATNAVRNTVTNDEGLYSFPSLVPGPYEVRVEIGGFRTAVSKLELQVQQTARVDFMLQVGQTSESIEARIRRVHCGSMSGRARQSSPGAASCRPMRSSSTCGGASSSTCSARQRATRSAVVPSRRMRFPAGRSPVDGILCH